MNSNARRAASGHAAVAVGTPDFGRNGGGIEGTFTDAGDAIANILHHLFLASDEASLNAREAFALSVFDRAAMHFKAELRGE